MGGNINRKTLVFGAVVLLLLTGLSPVYAGYSFSESNTMESKITETPNVENRNLLVRESFLDRYNSSEIEERYCNNPYLHRHDQHNLIRKPTIIDGVDGSWDIVVPDDYDTIQEAIYAAKDGFRIFVKSGIYYENIKIRSDSSLTLHGEDKVSTIIDASYHSDVIIIEKFTGINISGFTIKNSGEGFAGLNISSHYNIIRDNILVDNDHGIKLHYSSGNQIWNNEVRGNSEDGIRLHRSYANNISGNTVTGNGNNGITFTYSSLGTILDNNEISNHNENGVYLDESSLGNMFTRCTIKDNNYGVLCAGVSDGNIFHHNAFMENNLHAFDSSLDRWDYNNLGNFWDDYDGEDKDGDGVGDTPYVISGGNNKDRYPLMNQVMMYRDFDCKLNNSAKFNAECTTVSTGSSSSHNGWDIIVPDDYTTIQDAVDHASAGDRIFVRSGIYYENVNISIPDLTIHSENRETTIIDGGGNGHVVFVNEVGNGLNISGFTIQSSGKHFTGLYLWSDSSYVENIVCQECNIGLALRDGKDNIVQYSHFVNNNYGVWTWMCTNTLFEDNVIGNNSLDGIALQWSTSLNVSGNSIGNNSFDGVLEISCSDLEFENNNIQGNNEFGIQMFNSKNNRVDENSIKNNFDDGISIHKSTDNIFENNAIEDNSNGASFWFFSDRNYIENNKIYSNQDGVFIGLSSENTISSNNISSNNWAGIVLLYSSENNCVNNNEVCNNTMIGISFISSTYNNIWNNNIINNSIGIELRESSDINISINYISENNAFGIWCWSLSNNNYINQNNICTNLFGINFCSTSNSIIVNNKIFKNELEGISLSDSDNNIIEGNTISNQNYFGIKTGYSSENNIINNNVSENKWYGIYIGYSSCYNNVIDNFLFNNNNTIRIRYSSENNMIYQNNFIDNRCNANDECNNTWDNGKHGNYWDDYKEKYPDAHKKLRGIWSKPYEIPGGDNQDRYPLIKPYTKSKEKTVSTGFLKEILDRFPLLEGLLQFPVFEIYFGRGNISSDLDKGISGLYSWFEEHKLPYHLGIKRSIGNIFGGK